MRPSRWPPAGRIEALATVAELAGRSAPLAARQGGLLSTTFDTEPEGAIGLGALFVGTISAVGLETLVVGFTELPARVEEFTGGRAEVASSARLGSPAGRMLGAACELPAAGVSVFVQGGSVPTAPSLAQGAGRRRSLLSLCRAYVGTPCPEVSMYLELNADNAPPAKLGVAALGGLAILGQAEAPVCLPLH